MKNDSIKLQALLGLLAMVAEKLSTWQGKRASILRAYGHMLLTIADDLRRVAP